ncbi:MAG: hypothetical protein ABIK89_16910 [Planctomycetota bacterium]
MSGRKPQAGQTSLIRHRQRRPIGRLSAAWAARIGQSARTLLGTACLGALIAGCSSVAAPDHHPIDGLRLFQQEEPLKPETVDEWMAQQRPSP